MFKKSLAVILVFSIVLSTFTFVSAQEASYKAYTMELLPVADAIVSAVGNPAYTQMSSASAVQLDARPGKDYAVFRFERPSISMDITSITLDLSFRVGNVGNVTFNVYEYGTTMDDGSFWTNEISVNNSDIGLPDISTSSVIGTTTFVNPNNWGVIRNVSIPINTEYLSKNAAFLVEVVYDVNDLTRIFPSEVAYAYAPKLNVEYNLSTENIQTVALAPDADAFVGSKGTPAYTQMVSGSGPAYDIHSYDSVKYPASYAIYRFNTSYIPDYVTTVNLNLPFFVSATAGDVTFNVYEYSPTMDDGSFWTNDLAGNTSDIGLPDIDTTSPIASATYENPGRWTTRIVSIPIDKQYLSGKRDVAFLVRVNYDNKDELLRLLTNNYMSELYKPKLIVEYTLDIENTESVSMTPEADAGLQFTNAYAKMISGQTLTCNSYPGSPYIICRFDASDVSGKVMNANLTLSFITSYEGEMNFEVYEYSPTISGGTLWTEDLTGNTSDVGLGTVDIGFDAPIATGTTVTEGTAWADLHTVTINMPPRYMSDDVSLLIHVDYPKTKNDGADHEVTAFYMRESNFAPKLEMNICHESIVDLGYTFDNGSVNQILNELKTDEIAKSYAIYLSEEVDPDDIMFILALYDVTDGTLEFAETDFEVSGKKVTVSIDLKNVELENKELSCFLWKKDSLAPMIPVGQTLR